MKKEHELTAYKKHPFPCKCNYVCSSGRGECICVCEPTQKPSDIAIIQLIDACKYASDHLSPDQFAKAVDEGVQGKDFLIMVHGKLALKITESMS